MESEKYYEYCKELKQTMFLMLRNGKSGHIGGSLSIIESLAVTYLEFIKGTANKLVFSKGHCELAIYAILLKEKLIEEHWKDKLKLMGSILQGHPSHHWIEAIDYSAGSLGQGLSFAIGLAICGKESRYEVFSILGDGELQEGQIWEGLICASRLGLGNLNVIIDCNGLQLEGRTLVTGQVKNMSIVWKTMGWNTEIIENGHDFNQIKDGLRKKKNSSTPNVYFVKTIKGHGVGYMENNSAYHGVNLSESEIEKAIYCLEK